ncbi:LacI family DNA-binding transcriptional regulator [Mesorhizobium sp. NPDC059054]|uniref:LacI family DNA-binding transcriptional regulator n=1 Tax=Mesorhizobium sp. NPDC059054 TaxID=3346711 RepID=UPI00367F478E
MRPTVHDVAGEAGVSLATVDRVLNRRSGVRAETVARVNAAIVRLGYVRDISAANLAKQRVYNLLFIVPEGSNSFMLGLENELSQAKLYSVLDRTHLDIHKVKTFDADALAAVLEEIDAGQVSGVALVATESERVRRALVRLREAGVPVATLVSDVSEAYRDHYVGIDNIAAGRTAASLIGRFVGERTGKVALVAGSMLVKDHAERCAAFEQAIRGEFPGLECLPVIEGRDDAVVTRALLAELLDRERDVVGLYSIGAGNRGVIDVLTSRAEYRGITVVAHELTDHSKQALRDGIFDAVINQDAGHEVRSAIRLLKARIDDTPVIANQEAIRIEIYIRDNLP